MPAQPAGKTPNTTEPSPSLGPNANGYFSSSSKSKGGPHPPLSDVHTPGTPAVGDVIGNPTPFERFLSLGRTRKDSQIQFPPPHWGIGKEQGNDAPKEGPSIEQPASPLQLADPAVASGLEEGIDPPPEPNILARRIQALLAKSSVSGALDTPTNESQNSQPVVTHPPPQLVSDPKFVALLSSPSVMNGTLSKAGHSVWTVLDRLRAQLPSQISTPSGQSQPKDGGVNDREAVLDDDDSGFMVYGPLLPDGDSTVDLAESEYVPLDGGKPGARKAESGDRPPSGKSVPLEGLKDKLETVWPFKGRADGPANDDPSTARVHLQGATTKRVWIPSPDKISIQVMWWGYRIYLPPPVLDVLDNKQLEGAKRAALLTTALKYALDRVPIVMIPPPARPAMMLLKACTPYLGYVGGFVAWSWSAVKNFDKGNGVTLTATWLLTVAVIPGTWDEKCIPKNVRKPMSDDTSKASASEGVGRTSQACEV
ncbi:hypothetical protein PHLGIDRAFT_115730 [Phlebiopsis gigantea 11061_1 CR5-6]|uniref:Uncharacterized protein n=1 Tax=Phlebiopsis gigantea (strain 11061_1 CR5-6) TaxID=745531 RepID=A0A0C3PRY7_PHLG1|nr:hypothetical protein PHLGIDRAFT_115730 [Phlebiopsis gigantea 11061_1 CR5-6]